MDDLFTSRKTGVYHYTGGWNWRAYCAYVIGIIPNFYGFLNNMGVKAPIAVTRMYYFAYPIGLFISFFVYWGLNICWKPALYYPLSEWHEPKDYIRPEERLDDGSQREMSGARSVEGDVEAGRKGKEDMDSTIKMC